MRQVDLEARADWNQIALSVPCFITFDANGNRQGCGAAVGVMCIEHLAGTPKARADYHVNRKAAAMAKFEAGVIDAVNRDAGNSQDSEISSAGLRAGSTGDDTAGVGSNIEQHLPTPTDGPVQGDMPGVGAGVERKDDGDSGNGGVAQDDQLRPIDRGEETGDGIIV